MRRLRNRPRCFLTPEKGCCTDVKTAASCADVTTLSRCLRGVTVRRSWCFSCEGVTSRSCSTTFLVPVGQLPSAATHGTLSFRKPVSFRYSWSPGLERLIKVTTQVVPFFKSTLVDATAPQGAHQRRRPQALGTDQGETLQSGHDADKRQNFGLRPIVERNAIQQRDAIEQKQTRKQDVQPDSQDKGWKLFQSP